MTSRSLTNPPTTARSIRRAKAVKVRLHLSAAALLCCGLAAIGGGGSAFGQQPAARFNHLREPQPLPAATSAPRRMAHPQATNSTAVRPAQYATGFGHQYPVAQATHTVEQVTDTMAKTAVFQRAVSGKGNAIRLTNHHADTANHADDAGPTLRWVDPATTGEPLDDRRAGWKRRGDEPLNPADAMARPFAETDAVAADVGPAYAQQHAHSSDLRTAQLEPQPEPNLPESFRPFDDSPSLDAEPTPETPPIAPPADPSQPLMPHLPLASPQPESLELLDDAPRAAEPDLQAAPEPAAPEQAPAAPSDPGDAPAPPPAVVADPEPELPADEAEYYRQQLNLVANRDCVGEQARCHAVRFKPIQQISLDITPDYAFEEDTAVDRQRLREERLSTAPTREWRDGRGQLLASGRLVDYTQGDVHIAEAGGAVQRVPDYALSEADRCFLAAWWKLPLDCRVEAGEAPQRSFTPMTMTWTASALCNKPLYFEQRALERYGHAAHPLLQPALSGAHFFASIATLPYKAGIHPIYECQYDLGHYRPGSCAPWLVPPVPISLRGALLEAGVVTGGAFLIP